MNDLTIRFAQQNQPWTVPYSAAMTKCTWAMPHLLASHAVMHAMKSVGKLAGVFEALDHSWERHPSNEQLAVIKAMSADLLTAALRLANLYGFDLSDELESRVQEKNGVALRGEP